MLKWFGQILVGYFFLVAAGTQAFIFHHMYWGYDVTLTNFYDPTWIRLTELILPYFILGVAVYYFVSVLVSGMNFGGDKRW